MMGFRDPRVLLSLMAFWIVVAIVWELLPQVRHLLRAFFVG